MLRAFLSLVRPVRRGSSIRRRNRRGRRRRLLRPGVSGACSSAQYRARGLQDGPSCCTLHPTVAYEELKQRQSAMWGNGPYQRVTETLADIHELVIETLAPAPGDRWLDLACGTGAVAEQAAAARRERDRARPRTSPDRDGEGASRGAGPRDRLRASATSSSSTFDGRELRQGLVDVRDHVRARPRGRRARELARVTAPGGQIALANWTPTGGLAKMFEVMAPYMAGAAAEEPVRLGRRESRPRAAGRVVRPRARRARLDAARPVRRGLLGALLDELRPDEDACGLAGRPP